MGKDDGKNELVTVTRADLESMIKAGAEAAIAAQRGNLGITSEHSTLEERAHAQLGTPVPDRKPHRATHVRCRNARNGAEFTAVVVPSKTWPEGRVVNLINYTFPADIARRATERGIPYANVNDTGDPTVPGKRGLTTQFLQWRYATYELADRSLYQSQSAEFLPRLPGKDGEPTPEPETESARVFVG